MACVQPIHTVLSLLHLIVNSLSLDCFHNRGKQGTRSGRSPRRAVSCNSIRGAHPRTHTHTERSGHATVVCIYISRNRHRKYMLNCNLMTISSGRLTNCGRTISAFAFARSNAARSRCPPMCPNISSHISRFYYTFGRRASPIFVV